MVRRVIRAAVLLSVLCTCGGAPAGGDGAADKAWRPLPLIKDGKINPDWFHTGWGEFVIDDGALRTECDEKGLGLLVWGKEKFGDCQVRVVYRAKDPRSNSGVYVRIDDGILKKAGEKPSPAKRTADGTLTDDGIQAMKDASEKEQGPW